MPKTAARGAFDLSNVFGGQIANNLNRRPGVPRQKKHDHAAQQHQEQNNDDDFPFAHGTYGLASRSSKSEGWSQLSDLNRRPTVYKTVALPLS